MPHPSHSPDPREPRPRARPPSPALLLGLAALLGGCVSLTARERARTIGEDTVEIGVGASTSVDDLALLPRVSLDVGVSDRAEVGVRWDTLYFILFRGQYQLLDSTRDALDLSLHAGLGTGLFATVQGRLGASIGHRVGIFEPWLSLTHNSATGLGDLVDDDDDDGDDDDDLDGDDDGDIGGDTLIDASDIPAAHFLQPALGLRLHATEHLKFDVHANVLLPYSHPDRLIVLASLDVAVAF
ncbi:MAG: hypothetical protein H6701_16055 [Myxococcales bacterium]|nr:hypothetical protein [Myxococcales bacterium]